MDVEDRIIIRALVNEILNTQYLLRNLWRQLEWTTNSIDRYMKACEVSVRTDDEWEELELRAKESHRLLDKVQTSVFHEDDGIQMYGVE